MSTQILCHRIEKKINQKFAWLKVVSINISRSTVSDCAHFLVVPRIIYGLEAVQMLEGEKLELLKYERKLLEQLQGLTEKCATLATHVLIGATPIAIVIEKNTLTAFNNIARHEDFIEHEIALGQLAIKDENSNSWFTHIRKL